jgi:hypothetical protein
MNDGVSQCARYAFGPNRLHMCGPDANREVLAYLNEGSKRSEKQTALLRADETGEPMRRAPASPGFADGGLSHLLTQFKTLYPYLETIAHANKIEDIFDARVVEAYWLGNELLDSIQPKTFYRHLTENLQLKKHLKPAEFNTLTTKLSAPFSVNFSGFQRRAYARAHHNFHVMNVWKRTGHVQEEHTLESMDQCRISWGKVTAVEGPFISVERQPLALNGKLALGSPIQTKITRRLEDSSLMEDVAIGDVISIHWSMPCEILNPIQLTNLKRYTRQAIALANQTL